MANIDLNGSAQTGANLAVTATTSVVMVNHSKATLNLSVAHSAATVDTFTTVLGSGESFVYIPGTAGNLTPTVTPRHTGIGTNEKAEDPIGIPELADNNARFYYGVI